ncbi:MAG: DNA alkylation repair protein [bacterium]
MGSNISNVDVIIRKLKKQAKPGAKEAMARYGINTSFALGVSIPVLRKTAREEGKDHRLALALWKTGIHEARILAGMVDDPEALSEKQMDRWVRDFNSWDICDQCCSNLFDKTKFSYRKAIQWSKSPMEFTKRAGFVMMAVLAVHDKGACDEKFKRFFPLIRKASKDERNFVKKAVNWALRQIGKRSIALNKTAVKEAHQIERIDSSSSRWIAKDALRELQSSAVKKRLSK